MADIYLSNLGGGGGGGTITLTTTGTTGASTLVGTVLNIPVYQGQLTLTTTGSGAATLVGDTLNIPTATATTPAGTTGQVQFNNSGAFGASSNFFWDNANERLGIAISSPTARLQINGSGTTTSTSSLLIRDGATTPRDIFKVDDSALVTIESSTTFSSRGASRLLSSSAATDSDFVISPKGTGAFIFGPPPDGTTTGGNSRGQNAVDLQILRASASQVASGQRSVIIGGQDNTASGISTGVFCAVTSSAITNYSVVIGGQTNTSAAQYALSAGRFALANLYACQSFASNQFAAQGDAMTLSWRYMREITGTGAQELTLDKATVSTQGRAILVANRLWNVNLQLSAICSTVGSGTLTLGDSYIATYQVGIKRLVNTTTLVGTVQNVITAQSDSGMSTSAVSITADDTNECLKIEFTPPSTAGTTTVIRVVVTATATVVGY